MVWSNLPLPGSESSAPHIMPVLPNFLVVSVLDGTQNRGNTGLVKGETSPCGTAHQPSVQSDPGP
jgi:hypothetical protein